MTQLTFSFVILAAGLLMLLVSVPVLRTVERTRPDGHAGGLEQLSSFLFVGGIAIGVMGAVFTLSNLFFSQL